VEERRQNLMGFVTGVFRVSDFVSSALEKVDQTGVEFSLSDRTATVGKRRLHMSAAMRTSPREDEAVAQKLVKIPGRLALEIPLQAPGRQWILHLVQTQEFFVSNRTWHAWIVLLGGLLFTSFFGAFLLVMTGRTSLIETVVRQRTEALSGANQALRQSEQKFRSVTESATDAIIATDSDGTITSWNRGGELVFGYIEDEVLGKHVGLILGSRSLELYTEAMHRFSDVMGKPLEVEGIRKNGREFSCELVLSRWSTEQGAFYSAIIRDITERKKAGAEKALRRTEQSFLALTEAIPQIVWTAGPDGALDYYNQRWFDYTGLTLEQTKGWGWKPVLHPDDLNRCLDRWTEAVRTGGNYEIEYRFRRASDGAYRWHLGRGFPLRGDDGQVIKWFGTCTDIHEQKLAEAAIRETAARFRRIFESEMFGMIFWKYDGQIVDANEAFLKSVGYSQEDLSAGLINWKDMTPPEYTDMDAEALKQLTATGSARAFEKEYIRKDGSRVPVLVGWATLDGVPGTGGIAYVFDVTDRKQAEADRARLLASEHAAQEASRLKSEFLANMSHEIRTPLNGVIGMTSLLLDTTLNDEQRDQVDTIRRSGVALLAVINDILDFSKIESGKLELEIIDFDLRALVEDVEKTLALAATHKGLRLVSHVSSDVPLLLRGDSSRLHQILTNLVNNAIKFTPHGHVTVSVKQETEFHDDVRLYGEVTDTGLGIPPEALGRMFQAFSQADASTTRRFGGTGLGLSICKHLVTLMGGDIGVRSAPGAGSTFWFRVPLQKGQPLPNLSSTPLNETGLQRGEHCRILVVEDNRVNQTIAVKMLMKLGFRAEAVGNGREALDALRQIPYDLIVMDCQMPEMDGYEATAIIRKSASLNRKDIPIVAMTANATKSDEERCLQAGMDDYMTKPVSVDSFKAVLTKWLSKPAARLAVDCAPPAGNRIETPGLLDHSEPHIDRDMLASLRELNNDEDPEFFQKLIRNFLSDTTERVRGMRQAFTRSEMKQVQRDAHRLKGTCGNMGASYIGRLFGQLETDAESADQESAALRLSEIEKEFRLVEIALMTEVQRRA
jgi:PAS domain S-box-containing protein